MSSDPTPQDGLWKALADPTRRLLLDSLRGGPKTTGGLAERASISRYGVMKHLGVLVDAGLVRVERRGRQRLNHLTAEPLRALGDGWLGRLIAAVPGSAERDFFDPGAHGFLRVAAGVPTVALANPAVNAERIEALYARAAEGGAELACFPELALSGYSLDDLLQQEALLEAVLAALARLAATTSERAPPLVVGAPLRFRGRLFNCAVVLAGGAPLGVVPKTYLPNYREFYEKRHFASAREATFSTVELLGREVRFGNDLVFRARGEEAFAFHVELCEDLWTPIPPSTFAAFGGATVLCNLSASNATIAKGGYRRALVEGQSAKALAAYVYTAAGQGESTTDLAWDGHALIAENGALLAESERFSDEPRLVVADVDLGRLVQERMRLSSWVDCAAEHADRGVRPVPFDAQRSPRRGPPERWIDSLPFVPDDEALRSERCFETYNIQVTSLAQRMRAARIERLVIGVSGGLDSTQALLVAARTMDRLGLPRKHVLAYTMPGFATSDETLANAHALMKALRVTGSEIDIRPSCEQMLRDLGHPFAQGEPVYDVTFENVQAGERTSHLFRLANHHGALVVGTGDLSELALGWCTYGVGDQMSHYNVNTSVPKTLIRYLIEWVAEREDTRPATARVLRRILATDISPELVPPGEDGELQSTEATIGPYELHDFALYHATRGGAAPAKLLFLVACAWSRDLPISPEPGSAPATPAGQRYDLDELGRWLDVFLRRFFGTSQFKRSASPNGPKVGSGGSLSPRGDWRAPSDSSAAVWVAGLDEALAWARRSLQGPGD